MLPLFLAGLPCLVKGPGGQGQVTDESSVWIPVARMRVQLCSAQDRAAHVPSESLSPGCLLGQCTARERARGHSLGAARWLPSVQGDPAQPSPGTALPPYAIHPWHARVSSLLVSSAERPESQWQQRLGTLRWLRLLPAGPHSFAREPPPALALVNLQGLPVPCLF